MKPVAVGTHTGVESTYSLDVGTDKSEIQHFTYTQNNESWLLSRAALLLQIWHMRVVVGSGGSDKALILKVNPKNQITQV